MTDQMTASPSSLRTYADQHAAAAAGLGIHCAVADVTALSPTFGIIGAEFLAVLGQTLDARRRRLSALSQQHAALSSAAAVAASAYQATDDDAGRRFEARA